MKRIGINILLVMTLMLVLVGIGNAALAWVTPSSGGSITGTQVLNVTTPTSTTSNVSFTYQNNVTLPTPTMFASYANATANATAASFNVTWLAASLPGDGMYTINATSYSDTAGTTVEDSKTINIYVAASTVSFSIPVPATNTILSKGNTTVAGFVINTSEYCTAATLNFNGQTYSMSNTTLDGRQWTYTTAITNVPDASYQWTVSSTCTKAESGTAGPYLLALEEKGKGINLPQTQQQQQQNKAVPIILVGVGLVAAYLILRKD